jgi:hypothetical protein
MKTMEEKIGRRASKVKKNGQAWERLRGTHKLQFSVEYYIIHLSNAK